MKQMTLVLIALLCGALVGGSWVAWINQHGRIPTLRLAAEVPAVDSDGAIFRLQRLAAVNQVVDRYANKVAAIPGASLVIATVAYDATTVQSGSFTCGFTLQAGDSRWMSQSYLPPAPGDGYCEQGKNGTVTLLFEIPASYLNRVDGLAVIDSSTWLVMAGTVS